MNVGGGGVQRKKNQYQEGRRSSNNSLKIFTYIDYCLVDKVLKQQNISTSMKAIIEALSILYILLFHLYL